MRLIVKGTQSEDRVAAVALIHVNYARSVDVNHVRKLFMQKHPRRQCVCIMLSTIILLVLEFPPVEFNYKKLYLLS